jgi:probable rRNA maturation factor
MRLLINNTSDKEIDFHKELEEVTREVLKVENIGENVEISVTFVDQDEIKRLNKEFRNIDKVTDVLSFPLYDGEDLIKEDQEKNEEDEDFAYMLGDIVICMDVAENQAKEFGHSLERELMYLSCHSLLHLLGYDHMKEEDKKIMRSKEKTIMKNLGVFK